MGIIQVPVDCSVILDILMELLLNYQALLDSHEKELDWTVLIPCSPVPL